MPTGLERTVTGEQPRTLPVAATGTALSLATCTTPIATLTSTATSLTSGPEGQARILSSMSPGRAVGLLPAVAVGDGYGRHRMFGAGAAALAATPVLAALAPDTTTLGFPRGPHRTRATGVWVASWGAGIAVGLLLAGAAAGALGWRSTYWLIAALSTSLALLSWLVLTESRAKAHRRNPVDLPGTLLPGAALAGVLAGLVEARTSWSRPLDVGLLTGGVALGAVFVVVELRRRAPMLDLRLLGRPDFPDATIGALATGGGVIAITSVLPTLMQRALAHSASFVADVLFAWSATSVLTALPACQLPGCVSPGQPVKPAARRHPGRDRAEHTWHLALAAYRFAVPRQALETGRVLASLLWHDLPIQTGAGSRPRRPPGDPSGRDTRCHRDARPASQSVRGERAGGFVHAAFAAPAAPVEQVPGGPCTGNLREGRAASVPATDAATQSPDP